MRSVSDQYVDHRIVEVVVREVGLAKMPQRAKTRDGADIYWVSGELVLHPVEPQGNSGVSGDAFRTVLIEAAAAWNEAQTCAPRIKIAPVEPTPRRALQDGDSLVRLISNQWCPQNFADRTECYGSDRAAITRLYPHLQPGDVKHGSVVEADIEVNAVDYRWDEDGGLQRLQALLVHELGHALGLNHPCGETVSCSSVPDASASVMYPNPLELGRALVLAPDDEDVAGLCGEQPGPPAWVLMLYCVAIAIAGALLIRWLMRKLPRPPAVH